MPRGQYERHNGATISASNTDRPLVTDPNAAVERMPEEAALQTMHSALGHQADGLAGQHGDRLADQGLVSREELNLLLQKHEQEMKGILAVFEMFQKNDPRRGGLSSPEDLEQDRLATQRTLRELQTAERQAVYIAPEPYESKAIESAGQGQALYRIIQINGIQWPVPVGQIAQVPWQIAEIIHNADSGKRGLWRPGQSEGPPLLRMPGQAAQDLESIPRPAPPPWSDSMGRSGVVGEGALRSFAQGPAVPIETR